MSLVSIKLSASLSVLESVSWLAPCFCHNTYVLPPLTSLLWLVIREQRPAQQGTINGPLRLRVLTGPDRLHSRTDTLQLIAAYRGGTQRVLLLLLQRQYHCTHYDSCYSSYSTIITATTFVQINLIQGSGAETSRCYPINWPFLQFSSYTVRAFSFLWPGPKLSVRWFQRKHN